MMDINYIHDFLQNMGASPDTPSFHQVAHIMAIGGIDPTHLSHDQVASLMSLTHHDFVQSILSSGIAPGSLSLDHLAHMMASAGIDPARLSNDQIHTLMSLTPGDNSMHAESMHHQVSQGIGQSAYPEPQSGHVSPASDSEKHFDHPEHSLADHPATHVKRLAYAGMGWCSVPGCHCPAFLRAGVGSQVCLTCGHGYSMHAGS